MSIDDRPQIADDKSTIGGWPIDTVIGKRHSSALEAITERVTNFTVSKQVRGKTAAAVTEATIALLKPLKNVVHTITMDNGKTFAFHEK